MAIIDFAGRPPKPEGMELIVWKTKQTQMDHSYIYFQDLTAILFLLFFFLKLLWGGDALSGYHDETGYFLGNHGFMPQTTPLRWYINYALWEMFQYMAGIGFVWSILVSLSDQGPPQRFCNSFIWEKTGGFLCRLFHLVKWKSLIINK